LPPQRGAGAGRAFAVIDGGGAIKRTVEGGQHPALDEIEGRRLAIARARQVGLDRILKSAPKMFYRWRHTKG
jgi:hypothetical protein